MINASRQRHQTQAYGDGVVSRRAFQPAAQEQQTLFVSLAVFAWFFVVLALA